MHTRSVEAEPALLTNVPGAQVECAVHVAAFAELLNVPAAHCAH